MAYIFMDESGDLGFDSFDEDGLLRSSQGQTIGKIWIKDCKGGVLSYEDIMHYQKVIVALTHTDRVMKEIDMINFL